MLERGINLNQGNKDLILRETGGQRQYWGKGNIFFGTRDLFNISYSRELYLFSKFLHFEEIVRVKMVVCFEMIVSET